MLFSRTFLGIPLHRVCGVDQMRELDQVVWSEQRSPSGYDHKRISRDDVRPLCWNRLEMARVILEVDPVLVPRLPTRQQNVPSAS
jgi:hypothetical protein